MSDFKPRLTAYLIKIKELLDAEINETPGEAATFFLHERKINVARINVTGIVITKSPSQGYSEFLLDDGSGAIPVRAFDSQVLDPPVGAMVRVVGRARDYNAARYIIPEIVKILPDKNHLELHSLEINSADIRPSAAPKQAPQAAKRADDISPKQLVYELIKELDSGDGADITEIAKQADIEDVDGVIDSLIKDGEIFKVAPSRIKVL